jgi:hypothetical protein
MALVGTSVIVDAIDTAVKWLPIADPRVDVHLMAAPEQGGCQLAHVLGKPAHCDRVF